MDLSAKDANHFNYCLLRNKQNKIFICEACAQKSIYFIDYLVFELICPSVCIHGTNVQRNNSGRLFF